MLDVPGATFTAPNSINPEGTITGVYADASFVQHGFLRSRDGDFTSFDPPGSGDTFPTSINAAGAIVGDWYPAHGFLRIPDHDEEECEQRAECEQQH